MTAFEIIKILRQHLPFRHVVIPEYTHGSLRIDAIAIDMEHRWIRGFEIKVNHEDFKRDDKYVLYTQFCSSMSIVCPEGLIQPEEVEKPFGLLWVNNNGWGALKWKKRPVNFQKRKSMAWLWTYLHVLETEMPRMNLQIIKLIAQLQK